MNRRNVLIGLGGVVAGGGALLGTGAFTTVEAERTVSVETAGDADAFLGLSGVHPFVEETDGTIEINFDDDEDTTGDGLNLNARTEFAELVEISNNGTQDVGTVELDFTDGDDDFIDVIEFIIDGEEGSTHNETLEPGQAITFGLIFDLIDEEFGADEEFNLTLTITAEAEDEE